MNTWIERIHSIETQKVETFTGEGAYHGSTKQKPKDAPRPRRPDVPESRPTTLERYVEQGITTIGEFEATFPNRLRLVGQLDVPSQDEVRDDGVTFCWCPIEEALPEAGPVTLEVLLTMRQALTNRKRYVYVDSKIQYFEAGDLPVDSFLWHPDGTIAVRDDRVLDLGYTVLHDMRARVESDDMPLYQAYQSGDNCMTEWLDCPFTMRMPELIPNFNGFDAVIRAADVSAHVQQAGSIIGYDGLSLHRAVHATKPGWRLWLRVTETDVEIIPSAAIIECYNTVFRPQRVA